VGAPRGTRARPAIYRLLGRASLPRKTRGPAGKRAALIGREEELGRLVAAFERSEREGGHIAIVSGDAGIGKSRLIAELFAQVEDARTESSESRFLWLEGRCLPPAVSIAYWPFIDMLRELFAEGERIAALGQSETTGSGRGDSDGRSPVGSRTELAEAVGIARSLISPSVAQSPPAEVLSPQQAKERTFAALSTLFRALAVTAPSCSSSRTSTGPTSSPSS